MINKPKGMVLPKFVSVHCIGNFHLKCLVNIKVCPEFPELTARTMNASVTVLPLGAIALLSSVSV